MSIKRQVRRKLCKMVSLERLSNYLHVDLKVDHFTSLSRIQRHNNALKCKTHVQGLQSLCFCLLNPLLTFIYFVASSPLSSYCLSSLLWLPCLLTKIHRLKLVICKTKHGMFPDFQTRTRVTDFTYPRIVFT